MPNFCSNWLRSIREEDFLFKYAYFCNRQKQLKSVNLTPKKTNMKHMLKSYYFKLWASSDFNKSCIGPFKNFLFSTTGAILDLIWTYWISFRMGTTKGPILSNLVDSGPVVSEEKIKMWTVNNILETGHQVMAKTYPNSLSQVS